MSYQPEGAFKFTLMNNDKFYAKIRESWQDEYVLEMPNGKTRILCRSGFQFMDSVSPIEWQEIIAKAKTMNETAKSKKSDQPPAESQA